MAARICPQCSTRVDERHARMSPYCLRCGASLGAPSPPTTFGKPPAKGSALPWILGGIGLFVILGFGGVVVLIVVASSAAQPDPTLPVASATATGPKLESTSTSTAAAVPDAAPTPTVKVASTTPFVRTPAPTVTPTPTPTPTRVAITPTATSTAPAQRDAAADPPPPFPRAKANAELDRVLAGLNSCKQPEGPFGSGTIRVEFEPDGRTTVISRPPFAPTPVGRCISSRFFAIRLGKFDGPRQSFERGFIIQQ